MQRVYLLLRNNQQTGPYTIDELLQQQLRSTDMIWIEGQSTAWTYLSELALRPATDANTQEPAEPVRFSYKNEIERKAEEIRKRNLASKPRMVPKIHIEKPDEPAPDPSEIDEDTIVVVDHRAEKKYILNELLMTALIVALFAGGIYSSQTFLAGKKTVTRPAVTNKMVTTDDYAAKPRKEPDLTITQQMVQQMDSTETEKTVLNQAVKKIPPRPADTQMVVKTDLVAPVEPLPLPEKPVTSTEPTDKPVMQNQEAEKKQKAGSDTTENREDENAGQPKKRGFLKKLFKKKKKDEDAENKGTGEQPNN